MRPPPFLWGQNRAVRHSRPFAAKEDSIVLIGTSDFLALCLCITRKAAWHRVAYASICLVPTHF